MTTKDLARANLFEVEIEGFPQLTTLIKFCDVGGGDYFLKKFGLEEQPLTSLIIVENEDFDARQSFKYWPGRKLTIRNFKKNGDLAFEESFEIRTINYSSSYDWDSGEPIYWNVELGLDDGIEN